MIGRIINGKKFINMTPHDINLIQKNGKSINIKPCGAIVRVPKTNQKIGELCGTPICIPMYEKPTGLPPESEEPNTVYIISQIALDAIKDRKDICAPALLIRDANGKVTGCRALTVPHPEKGKVYWYE